jgi:hypothetical protein
MGPTVGTLLNVTRRCKAEMLIPTILPTFVLHPSVIGKRSLSACSELPNQLYGLVPPNRSEHTAKLIPLSAFQYFQSSLPGLAH